MTDYKQLCADLHAAFNTYAVDMAHHDLLERARAALAEPEPEGPTDEEIMEVMPQQMRDDLAAAARALAGFDPDNIKAASVFRIILNRHFVDHSRAVLARWGNHPALQPISVTERLPGPEDCDEQGRCYAWDWLASDWRMVPAERVRTRGRRVAMQRKGVTRGTAAELVQTKPDYNWWLPATALPLPS